jgi:hypothetical protein
MEVTAGGKNEGTVVARLRVRGSGLDPIRARFRITSLLGNANAQPAALPPSAIAFVRKLRDPLPRSLRLQKSSLRPPPAWQQALTKALDQLVGNAARPAMEVVPASAEAVVFLDRSEVLACMASDWCEGHVIPRWWWQSLLTKGTASEVVKRLWREAPEYVPAALEHLFAWGKGAQFINLLSDTEARDLLQRVVASFALRTMITASLDDEIYSGYGRQEPGVLLGLSSQQSGSQMSKAQLSGIAPWRSWVPEIAELELRPNHQLLIGIALMLRRAPDTVRAAGFAHEVRQWREMKSHEVIAGKGDSKRVAQDESAVNNGKQLSGSLLQPSVETSDSAQSVRDRSPSQMQDHAPGNSLVAGRSQQFAGSKIVPPQNPTLDCRPTELKPGASVRMHEIGGRDVSIGQADRGPVPVSVGERASIAGQDIIGGDARTAVAAAARNAEEFEINSHQIQTNFGGLFYLINLGLFLELYTDFTNPSVPGIALNIWDFIALLGFEFVGERIQGDPVWALLARLAGRQPDDPPGQTFEPDDQWRVPPEWLKPFSMDVPFEWTTARRRLRVFHTDQFVMLDVALQQGDPIEQLERELKAYESLGLRVASIESSEEPIGGREIENQKSTPEIVSPLGLWLAHLMPYVRARLRRALGVEGTKDPTPALCLHPARVWVTATHLDVFLLLDELPIEIRRAGLDRNPGWVPAAGRFIAFHFE